MTESLISLHKGSLLFFVILFINLSYGSAGLAVDTTVQDQEEKQDEKEETLQENMIRNKSIMYIEPRLEKTLMQILYSRFSCPGTIQGK